MQKPRFAFQIWSNSISRFRKFEFKIKNFIKFPNILKFPNYHSNLFPSISIQKLPQSKENPFSSPETKRRLDFWGVPHGVTPTVRPRGKRNVSIPVICSRLVHFAPGLVAVEHREGAADGVGVVDQRDLVVPARCRRRSTSVFGASRVNILEKFGTDSEERKTEGKVRFRQ